MKRICLLAAVILLSACATSLPQPFDPHRTGEAKILIAMKNSEFKNAVVNRVLGELRKRGHSYRAVAPGGLKSETAESFEAVVILHSVHAYRLPKSVHRFVNSTSDAGKARIIVLSTTADPRHQVAIKDVQAITSASKMSRVGEVSTKILNQISERLSE